MTSRAMAHLQSLNKSLPIRLIGNQHAIKTSRDLPVQTQPQSVIHFQMYIIKYKPPRSSRKLDVASQLSIVRLRVFPMNLDRRFLNHATSFSTSHATTYFINRSDFSYLSNLSKYILQFSSLINGFH